MKLREYNKCDSKVYKMRIYRTNQVKKYTKIDKKISSELDRKVKNGKE